MQCDDLFFLFLYLAHLAEIILGWLCFSHGCSYCSFGFPWAVGDPVGGSMVLGMQAVVQPRWSSVWCWMVVLHSMLEQVAPPPMVVEVVAVFYGST